MVFISASEALQFFPWPSSFIGSLAVHQYLGFIIHQLSTLAISAITFTIIAVIKENAITIRFLIIVATMPNC